MGDKKENSYSHILKYTGLFGSVQGLGILVGVLRNKFTALFLGPSGMGLLSLFSALRFLFSVLRVISAFLQVVSNLFLKRNMLQMDRSPKRLISPGRFFLSAPIVCLLHFSEPSSVFFWVRYSMGLLFPGAIIRYISFSWHQPFSSRFWLEVKQPF